MASWFEYLYPDIAFPSCRIFSRCQSISKKAHSFASEDELLSFLAKPLLLDGVSQALDNIGLNRPVLEDISSFHVNDEDVVTNEIVLDLEMYFKREHRSSLFLFSWIVTLTGSAVNEMKPGSFARYVKILKEKRLKLMKRKECHQELADFLSQPFDTSFCGKPKPEPEKPEVTYDMLQHQLQESTEYASKLKSENDCVNVILEQQQLAQINMEVRFDELKEDMKAVLLEREGVLGEVERLRKSVHALTETNHNLTLELEQKSNSLKD